MSAHTPTPRDAATRPSEPRLDAVFSGDGKDDRAALAADPRLGPEYAELAAVEQQLATAMAALRSRISPPGRVVSQWTATCRAMLPTPAGKSSRRRSFVRHPRAGALAAMVLFTGLVGLLTLEIMPRIDRSMRHRLAIGQLQTLQLAILSYHDAHNEYPPSGNDSLVRYLDGNPANGGPGMCYFKFMDSEVSPALEYLDPWGNPYQYRTGSDATHNGGRFDLWSHGPTERRAEEMLANWMDEVMQSPPKQD